MKHFLLITVAVVIGIILADAGLGYFYNAPSFRLGGLYDSPLTSKVGRIATSGAAYLSANNTGVVIMATSTARSYALICNTANTAPVFLGFGVTPSADTGVMIAGKTCYELKASSGNLFTGAVYGAASSTEASQDILTIIEIN